MTSADHSYGQVPAPLGPGKALQPYDLEDLYGGEPAATPRRFNVKLVWRAVRRHWWQALTVWAVASAALMVVTYYKVKPTYDAWAQIKIEQTDNSIFGKSLNQIDFQEYKETQVKMMTNTNVLTAALSAHPELLSLPMLARSEDAEAEIKRNLIVGIVPKTNLISVGMSSEYPHEAVAIVNAVVDAYIKTALDQSDEDSERRIGRLRLARNSRLTDVEAKRAELKDLQKQFGAAYEEQIKQRDTLTLENYAVLSTELLKLQIERMSAEQALSQMRNERPATSLRNPQVDLADQMNELFFAHPDVQPIQRDLEIARQRYAEASRVARNPNADPAASYQRRAIEKLEAKLSALYNQLQPALAAEIENPGSTSGEYGRALADAERRVKEMQAQEQALEERLSILNVKSKEEGNQALQIQFANADLARAERAYDAIQQVLDQAEFEAKSPIARLNKEFSAKPSNKPSTNHRYKVMALAPFIVLAAIVGLLVLVELQAGRVADPDELPGRLRLQVLGVVPPLPQIRSGGGPSMGGDGGGHGHGGGGGAVETASYRTDYRSQRQLDEFVQSLDHLRVSLCSTPTLNGDGRRCLLITSACGSEGKTTLAAQLAERCVNAGLMTLLIDGDLRNPTLSRVLDVADNRGLINVLRDEISTDEALTVIGGAGGFHLLPAGTPRVDPSRLLQGDRLGRVITQVRASFDIVIVDAPPVLPVPDALTMGRWTDGAVLAVRYDTSRFPLVERANRRLASVGVPVIGAVVNGVRSASSSYYGSYYPAGAAMGDDSAMLDV